RLLDWSEGALLALHFALKTERPIIWMLNPLELNSLSYTEPSKKQVREFPLPWIKPHPPLINPAFENLAGAWEQDQRGVQLPVAVYPTYVHPRLRGQRACFTIHGKKKEGLVALVSDQLLKRYEIDPAHSQSMLRELE